MLQKAFRNFIKLFPEEQLFFKHSDASGIYCYETTHYMITAKRYIWNGIISVHNKILFDAYAKQKKIVVFISENNSFYFFKPEKIMDEGYENLRGKIIMINFPVKISERVISLTKNGLRNYV
ncbi:MAG: hypothetical protein DRO01_00110 [Thermoproteota archaeon]|nr:MAG: hypothetical protein DRO01_00110 [Candidatus Korarchaeota archaeon]